MVGMDRPAFSLRLDPALRDRVRVVAQRAGISQNEFLERAAEHEVVARGALLAEELEAAASHLRTVSAPAAAEQVEASITAFVEAESGPDPIRPRQITREPVQVAAPSMVGAVAAFQRR